MSIYINNFSIRVLETPTSLPLFSMESGKTLLSLRSDLSLFNSNASVILADPFLFIWNNRLFLFYEHLKKWYGKGRICMRYTDDLINWSEEIEILNEPFHLSFPFVFEDDGAVYMIPETGEDHSISLYKAVDDSLAKWKRVKKLIEGEIPWYDSVVLKKGSSYYLFTGHDNLKCQTQHLFVSNNLLGPYKEHPMSPIYNGRDGGRNAGSIIDHNGTYYRPVQMCIDSYGAQVSIMQIKCITPTDYQEGEYKKNILKESGPTYRYGGHQWNAVEFLGRRVIATDYREKNYNLVELFRRIKRNCKK